MGLAQGGLEGGGLLPCHPGSGAPDHMGGDNYKTGGSQTRTSAACTGRRATTALIPRGASGTSSTPSPRPNLRMALGPCCCGSITATAATRCRGKLPAPASGAALSRVLCVSRGRARHRGGTGGTQPLSEKSASPWRTAHWRQLCGTPRRIASGFGRVIRAAEKHLKGWGFGRVWSQ